MLALLLCRKRQPGWITCCVYLSVFLVITTVGKTGGLGGAANTPQAIAKRYSTGGVALKLENVDKFWGIKHEIAK